MPSDCDPEEIKTLGHELWGRDDIPSLRAALGRFYYANFRLACQTVVPKFKIELNGRGGDHGKIFGKLRSQGRARMVGELLKTLYTYREHADYHFDQQRRPDECPLCSENFTLSAATKKGIADRADECFRRLSSL